MRQLYRVDIKGFKPFRHQWPGSGFVLSCSDQFDVVYSFRSGKGNEISRIRIPDFQNQKPAQRLKSLGSFYRDFSESVAASSTAAALEGDARYATSDVGHEFVSAKTRATPIEGKPYNISTGVTGNVHLYPPHMGNFLNGNEKLAVRFWDYFYTRYPDQRLNTLRGTTVKDTQATLNQLFNSMRQHTPVANVGETIVELIKGGPFLLLSQALQQFGNFTKLLGKTSVSTKQLRDLAGETGGTYLYSQFAVAPFFGDIAKVLSTLTTIHTMVYGQSDRQRRIVPAQVSMTKGSDVPTAVPPWSTPTIPFGELGSACNWTMRQSWDTRLTARFSGLAKPNTVHQGFLDKADALMYNLGLQDPELIWNLTSFSWLLDWWFHLGTSISNAYAFSGNGVNVDYAYSTTVIRTHVTMEVTGQRIFSNPVIFDRPAGLSKVYTEVKYRRRANPFGFGGDLSSLTSGQMSILAALGLVKTR